MTPGCEAALASYEQALHLFQQVGSKLGEANVRKAITDSNRGKTAELGATWNPVKPLNIVLSGYSGPETIPQSTPGAPSGVRTSGNLVVSYAFTDAFSLGLEYLNVSQDKVPSGTGTIKAKYSGYAGYLTYQMTPKWRGVIRLESFDDHDGFPITLL